MRIGICWVVLRGPYARTLQSTFHPVFYNYHTYSRTESTQGTKVCKDRSIPGVVTVCSYPTEITLRFCVPAATIPAVPVNIRGTTCTLHNCDYPGRLTSPPRTYLEVYPHKQHTEQDPPSSEKQKQICYRTHHTTRGIGEGA